jgi:undecaprenyl pyrophosphate phosphatase UppP
MQAYAQWNGWTWLVLVITIVLLGGSLTTAILAALVLCWPIAGMLFVIHGLVIWASKQKG